MIITKLMGGLGNQMFQYATGLAVAERNHTELFIDTSWYREPRTNGDTPREYELDIFTISGQECPAKLQQQILRQMTNSRLKQRIGRLLDPQAPRIQFVIENDADPMSNFDAAGDNSMFIGWWNSQNFFSDIRLKILEEFNFKPEPSKANQELLEQIKSSNAISIHVRRGDYVSNAAAAVFHGLSGVPYYEAAMAIINPQVKQPHYFVFSDDIAWCRENLATPYNITFVDLNSGKTSYEDLRLMSNCKHHIVANSTFSWWGAWLNTSDDKIVIAPKAWFADPSKSSDAIVPSAWQQL